MKPGLDGESLLLLVVEILLSDSHAGKPPMLSRANAKSHFLVEAVALMPVRINAIAVD